MDSTGIIFRGDDGRTLTWNDVKDLHGPVRYEIVWPDAGLPEAQELHTRGRDAGSADDYQAAIAFFEQAQRLAPGWPYPVYDEAFSYLLIGNGEKAEELYARVDEMAPRGFFTAKVALDHLRRERKGTIPKGTYLKLVRLEFESDTKVAVKALKSIVSKNKAVPRAWQMLAALAPADDSKLVAISKGLACDPDRETRGMLLIYKAQVLAHQNHRDQAITILGELATDPASTLGVEHLSKLALQQLIRGPGGEFRREPSNCYGTTPGQGTHARFGGGVVDSDSEVRDDG